MLKESALSKTKKGKIGNLALIPLDWTLHQLHVDIWRE